MRARSLYPWVNAASIGGRLAPPGRVSPDATITSLPPLRRRSRLALVLVPALVPGLAVAACGTTSHGQVVDGGGVDATLLIDASAVDATPACGRGASTSVSKTMFHGDRARTGWNAAETDLTPSAVGSASFGALWSSDAFDALVIGGTSYVGRMFASPLYVDGVDVAGHRLAVVYAATSNGFVYAVNAVADSCVGDTNAAGALLWKKALAPAGVVPRLDGSDALPGIALGVLSTPVIDAAATPPRIYVTSMDASSSPAAWKLFALDLSTGAPLAGYPIALSPAAVEPVNQNGPARLDPDATHLSQRSALALSPSGDRIYVAFGGYGDVAVGWMIAVDTAAAKVAASFSAAPDTTLETNGGIWAPGGPAIDDDGTLYTTVGNGAGTFIGRDGGWGESMLALRADLTLAGTYTPWNYCQSEASDADVGGDSPMLLPALDAGDASASAPRLLAFGSKQGIVYLLDRASLPGNTSRRQACDTAWDGAQRDGSLLPPDARPEYCDPAAPASCARGPLSVFGKYSDGLTANNVNHAKMRSTPAYFRGPAGEPYVFVSGTSKSTVDPRSFANIAPSLARLRVVVGAAGAAYLARDAQNDEVVLINPGSPIVTSHGSADAVVWVFDENALKSTALLEPTLPHPALYVFDASTMRLLWRSGATELDRGAKYVEPVVAHGLVLVGTDRIQAFGLPRR